jgi:hypothetical protein
MNNNRLTFTNLHGFKPAKTGQCPYLGRERHSTNTGSYRSFTAAQLEVILQFHP